MTETTTTLTHEAFAAFRMRVKGEILLPGDGAYQEATEIHNAIIDRKPAIIVKAKDASDVSRAVHFARQHNLPLSVRSGGHSFPGYSLVDDGVTIDMTAMKEIQIDPKTRTAWVQPGALTGEVTRAAQEHGLAVPFGDAGSVGVGGITLGGGIGFLARKHGLTIDHLVGVELVTADGRIVEASATENEELFWGLRGGGGNFGVVTGFQYELVQAGIVGGGLLGLPATPEVVRAYARLAMEAPEELTTISMLMLAPPLPFIPEDKVGQPMLGIFMIYAGDPAEADAAVAPLRALAEPIVDMVGPMPYATIYELLKDVEMRRRERVRSSFFDDIDPFVDGLLEQLTKSPSPMGMFQIRPLGGQMARVPMEATAFSHRQARFLVTIINVYDEAADDEAVADWVQTSWDLLKDYRRGVYSNFLEAEGDARIREAYAAETHARLAALKHDWDPENVFSSNQNIRPVARTTATAA